MSSIVKPVSDEKEAKRNAFSFTNEFKREFDCAIKAYEEMFSEFNKVTSSTTVDIQDEYGICNNSYKLRFISPNNISTFISYVMKAFKNHLIMPNIGDMDKFVVANAKQFMVDNGCVPFENSSIYGMYQYTSDQMTLQDLLILSENDVYHTSVCSKYDMTQRKVSMKSDVDKIKNLHFTANMKKVVNALPELINKNTQFVDLDYPVRALITTYIEAFILFATTLNCVTMSNMILYCIPKSTYNKKLVSSDKLEVKYNSLMEENDTKEHAYTECCLLKTNGIMLSNKIPFNINMRDIVLQDMHPQFKDTQSAIHFIMTDNRSPISQLILKYSKEDHIQHMNIDTVVNLFSSDMRCHCKYDKDFFDQYGDVDFHTDVNWLDKIAYGNNYLNGNYRKDGVGNHHFNPMTNTLETLYRMFGDCSLCSSEELANHIVIVSQLMNNIITCYKECRIQNWDLTRDALAVLGEIMTRCMIKLYNNHMTVFIAKDNMDNVDIPGYLYTESFIMEADDNKPKVEIEDGPTDGTMKSDVKNAINKAKQVVAQVMHKFIAWVNSVLAKAPLKFIDAHKAELAWIEKNEDLNDEIYNALGDTFNPSVTNFPNYVIPQKEIIERNVSDIIKPYLDDDKKPIDALEIKKAFYPPKVANKLTANGNNTNQNSKDKSSPEAEWFNNFFLYGDPDHQVQNGKTDTLKKKQWKQMCDDLLQSQKLLKDTVDKMAEDLNKAATDIEQRAKNVKDQGSDDAEKTANNELSKRYTELGNILRDISKSYHVAFINTIQTKFYATTYTLYRDIITAYNQQKGKNTSDGNTGNTTKESFVDAIDGLRNIIV